MARRRPFPFVCGPVTAGVLVAAAACGGALEDAPGGGGTARPGAPFDVEAFERIGASYAEFLESGADGCDGGRCRLSYRFVSSPERGSGCAVADVRYRPPERPDPQHPGRFLVQRGAAVTVVFACAAAEEVPPVGTG